MTDFLLETTAGDLAKAVRLAAKAIHRSYIPILSAVRLEDRRVTATNLDQELSVAFAAAAMQGALVAPAQAFALLNHIEADAPVSIVAKKGTAGSSAILTFPGGSYDLPTFPEADFPVLMQKSWKAQTIAGNAATGLVQALQRVTYAISTEETRYYLNGVCLDAFEGAPCVVATDGHRLAWAQAHVPWDAGWHGLIVPKDAMKLILAIGACERLTALRVADGERPSALTIEAAGARLTSKLVEGTYPNWKRVVPRAVGGEGAYTDSPGAPQRLALPVGPTRKALARLRTMSMAKGCHVGARIALHGTDHVSVAARDSDGHLAVEVLPLGGFGAPDDPLKGHVEFAASYLDAILKHADGEIACLITENGARDSDGHAQGPFALRTETGGHLVMSRRAGHRFDEVASRAAGLLDGHVSGDASGRSEGTERASKSEAA